MRRLTTEPYLTPSGYVDFPFAYVYDATGLTDGSTVMSIQKTLQGDCDFILRRIVGVPTCVDTPANGGKFNFKNASGSYAVSNTNGGIVMPNVYTVVPEKLYPVNSSIVFDLFKVLRNSTACGGNPIKNSFIAFFGVKRIPLGRGYAVRDTPYLYKEFRYSYEYSLTITKGHFATVGGNAVTATQRAVIQMDNYDFELLQIAISANEDGEGAGTTGALLTNDFQIQLYDANMHQLSDLPLNQGYVNGARRTKVLPPPYQAVTPVPSLVYPAGGNIVFDVTSMLCADNVPQTYNLSFQGIWRKPC